MRYARFLLLGLLALALALAPEASFVRNDAPAAQAAGGSYVLVNIANTNDAAPGTGGGTFSSFDGPALGADGNVAFRGLVAGGTVSEGIFTGSSGSTSAVALPGDTAPGTGGGAFTSTYDARLNLAGSIVFGANVGGGTASQGIFLRAGETTSALALTGQDAPGTGGGTFNAVVNPSLNGSGHVVFTGSVSGGTAIQGIFRHTGVTTDVVLQGQTAPDTGGGTFFPGMHGFLNDSGMVAFWSGIYLGTVGSSGLFLHSGDVSAVALLGDPAPGTGGGTVSNNPGDLAINASGNVIFIANVQGGTVNEGIFLRSGGSVSEVVLPGEPAPGTGGGSFLGLNRYPAINDNGEVAFVASVGDGTVTGGVFLESGGTVAPVALIGESAPGTGGGTFSDFGIAPALSNGGSVAFRASVSGGSTTQGIFLALPDSDGDGTPDIDDNCPFVATPWYVPVSDGDCDAFTDADEGVIGTDPNVFCGPGCWPPDFDDNQVINILDVNEVLPPHFGMTSSSPGWDSRYDLVVNGVINVLDVNMTLPPTFGQTCTP